MTPGRPGGAGRAAQGRRAGAQRRVPTSTSPAGVDGSFGRRPLRSAVRSIVRSPGAATVGGGVGDLRLSGRSRRHQRRDEPAAASACRRVGDVAHGRGQLLVRAVRRLPRILEPAEVAALLAALRTERDRAMVQAMVLGGLRRCEVLGPARRINAWASGGCSSPRARVASAAGVPLSPTFFTTVAAFMNSERPPGARMDRVFVALVHGTCHELRPGAREDAAMSAATAPILVDDERGPIRDCAQVAARRSRSGGDRGRLLARAGPLTPSSVQAAGDAPGGLSVGGRQWLVVGDLLARRALLVDGDRSLVLEQRDRIGRPLAGQEPLAAVRVRPHPRALAAQFVRAGGVDVPPQHGGVVDAVVVRELPQPVIAPAERRVADAARRGLEREERVTPRLGRQVRPGALGDCGEQREVHLVGADGLVGRRRGAVEPLVQRRVAGDRRCERARSAT